MRKKQVAVIDIGSKSVSTCIGENGINNTFIIKFQNSYDYDGFSEGEFFDKESFSSLMQTIARDIKRAFQGNIGIVYVGVPGDFTQVIVRDQQISFAKKKKIVDKDIDTLYDLAYKAESDNFTLINRSSVMFELDDFRRVANPVGISSEILKAKLSFILCKNYLIELVEPPLLKVGASRVEFVSSSLAQSIYLIEPDVRDRLAVLLDVGYITTTLSVIHGDGIVFMKSFDFGAGYITADLVDRLGISIDDAEDIKRRVNLTSINEEEKIDILEAGSGRYFTSLQIRNCITESLDTLCEGITKAFNEFNTYIPEYVSLMITGGGITYLRGAKEHVAGRLNMSVQVAVPKVPMMEKPTMSSLLSLLSLALEQN